MSDHSHRIRIGDHNFAVTIKTLPTAEPVSLAEVKDHLRITRNDQDDFLTNLISRARQHLEQLLNRTIPVTTYEMRLDRFPGTHGLHDWRDPTTDIRRRDAIIPLFPPLLSATISYRDVDDVPTVLAASEFTVDIFSEPGAIVPEFAKDWPTTRGHINDITVTYTAGYDETTHFLSQSITHSLLMLISHWHEHREAAIEAPVPRAMAFAMDSLVSQNRVRQFA